MNAVSLTEMTRVFCIYIVKLVYLNILWFLFTLLGLVVLGIAPATVALCRVQKMWLEERHVPSIFSLFWQEYKKHFKKSNLLALTMLILGYLIYFDLKFFVQKDGLFNQIISLFIFILSIWYIIILIYIFPTYVHYQLKWWKYIQYAFVIGMVNPLKTIGMGIALWGMIYLSLYFPQILMSIGVSLTFFIIMIVGCRSVEQISILKAQYNQT
ncbi:DUF624 domain-containing protein [Gracilibacillus sp. YIM 98692]|uniref:YesL family protein n=1 Tax=Gracilibacillus sp. YIM 98692 TaxID=2663532 RepID=UPI0013CF542A|nr:DUF624 domain-containing protein [Gracilibacillus sp. YIM 98692]